MNRADPLVAMAETPWIAAQLVRSAGEGVFDRPLAAGKWTVGQLLTHLAQTEMVFATRVRFALTEAEYVVQPYDQDRWLSVEAAIDGAAALDIWLALGRFNLPLFVEGTAAHLDRPLVHPERGRMTLRVLLETIAGHDLHHLTQLESALGGGAGQ